MVEASNKANLLEAVEKDQYEVRSADETGGGPSLAWQHANTRKSYWRTAHSWILVTTLTNGFLHRKGWVCLGDVYKKRTQGSY